MNKKILIPTIALLAVLLIAPVMAAKPVNKVTGGGEIVDQWSCSASFGVTAAIDALGNVKGQMEYNRKAGVPAPPHVHFKMHSTSITSFIFPAPVAWPTWVQISGTCRYMVLGVWYTGSFIVDLYDGGEPGIGIDWLRVRLDGGLLYDSAWQPLVGGNIQVK